MEADQNPGMAGLHQGARRALRWETGLVVVIIAILVVGGLVSPEFLTGGNIFNLGLSYGEIAIMTLPMALIIISGEIDLSVASMLGMSSAILGVLWSDHWPMLAIFVVVLIAGALAGRLGCSVLNSDRIRKELAGVSPGERSAAGYGSGIYAPEWTERTYGELLSRAARLRSP